MMPLEWMRASRGPPVWHAQSRGPSPIFWKLYVLFEILFFEVAPFLWRRKPLGKNTLVTLRSMFGD